MAAVRHVFVSVSGELLPRWVEAFPRAVACRFGETVPASRSPVLLWLRLPGGPVAEVLENVRGIFGPDAMCIALADMPNDDEALACFAAAAKGYCNTHSVPSLLRRVADVVSHGGLWIGESLMQRLLRGTAHLPPPAPADVPTTWDTLLTVREREVARAVAIGDSNKEIARKLGITERTVKAHVGAVFEKLKVRDRLQLSLVVNGHRRL